MSTRRFLAAFCCAVLASAAALAVFNARRSHRGANERNILERLVARQIAEGHSLIPPPGVDEAALRWHTADQLRATPNIVVLGSSHTLRLSGAILGRRDVQNLSISGGNLTEHLISSSLLADRGLRPRVWIIAVDPWYFDRDTDFGMWKLRGPELVSFERQLDHSARPWLRPIFGPRWHPPAEAGLSERLSLTPLLSWLDDLGRRVGYRPALVDPNAPNPPFLILRSDGAYQVAPEPRKPGDDTPGELARKQFRQNIDRHRYGTFARIDPGLWELFERWIAWCREDGARVELVLTPYHPAIYQEIVAQPDNQLRRIERLVRDFAARTGVGLQGSYDPAKLGLTDADFLDGDHLDENGLRVLCAPMLDSLPKDAAPAGTGAP